MRSPGAELRKASSRRGYLHPFKSFSTSRVPRHVEPSPEREEKPKKEGRGFFSQLRRSLTLSHRSSSSSTAAIADPPATAARAPASAASKEGAQPPWGRRVKHGLSKPLKIVKTSYVDCMMGIAEDPRVEGMATAGFHRSDSQAYAFQASASRRAQNSSSSIEAGLVPPTDAQLQALLLRGSKRHAHVISSE